MSQIRIIEGQNDVQLTGRFINPGENVDRGPAMSSGYTRICVAFEQRSKQVAMFFTLRAPGSSQLLENAVIRESMKQFLSILGLGDITAFLRMFERL